MVIPLIDLPVKHSFYLSYESYPIALGTYPMSGYKVLETKVIRVQNKEEEYYVFQHLVESLGRHPTMPSSPPSL